MPGACRRSRRSRYRQSCRLAPVASGSALAEPIRMYISSGATFIPTHARNRSRSPHDTPSRRPPRRRFRGEPGSEGAGRMAESGIRMYGTSWCSDCKRAKKFFGAHRVRYEFVDVDVDAEGLRVVEETNRGKRIIPTIFFADGSVLVEPSNAELA